MLSFEKQYKGALKDILLRGSMRENRTDTDSLSVFDVGFKFSVNERYPILTSKLIDINIVNTEFEWFVTGQTTIDLFKERGIRIWEQWADEDGKLGPVYGHQLRSFNSSGHDQLKKVIESISENPFHRRHIITLWNPQQLDEMALPPCYLYFQFYVTSNGFLNMFVVQRSGDMFVGVPYDVCVFTNLLSYVAQQTGLCPNVISLRVIDAHIYEDHIEACKIYLGRNRSPHPKYKFKNHQAQVLAYNPLPRIKVNVAK